ncbi:tRNA (adenosine(37)-N6)-threonylcarbamoyltransferase complex ATPase subunit type 1 TsaE [Mammaliicoccus sciuri]|uniref:tRNA (adenosine(37)-N6)-threonylcarbamoyltransferase complex ATPase subunit type 1 TsaE n=1 Tax=Mammaliicoccus sciuri TaxID=1296 RepID=UPI0021D37540|nr:tRNA (adenosine(37)-N6)-threonylcarbamoyltransferase complex ATPase subunit type 1 TsaE [Mammaliicoccus sciuri]UXU85169.1 tRNA (adenosine(37)-N6)-threonylcarbamoyltransferase complex ATPase subunit type 1 TsaE [Mammaliicoccus sciuri]UXU95015.1 tRNA (adenosine(37)-N6)-threonylcarbamoyltransferase complex ATPase subunit type 1 TsaE [Mammaliicoccus sciuri]UXV16980.1 tRNA (adenosine(37)-N6)-threonylcarbamoyltransferase complex ATPase subunit type 1 TsaE [Mammaliicoccus sciuri]UXV25224.1 tRNA (ad
MIEVDSLEKTQQIAEKLAQVVTENDIILLNGDLGAGKTTFSQYFGKALGVKRNINSPTFNLIKSYKGRLPLHHMDCYRLEDSDEDLGFDEYFNDNGVTIIEWSEFIQEYLPKERLEINIKYIDADKRVFEIISKGEHYKQIKEVLNDDNITN